MATKTQPISIIDLIELDHAHLTKLTYQLRSRTLPVSEFQPLLQTIIVGLIRHDNSEELIMRPAFVTYFHNQGREMAEHDRQDHDAVKAKLISLLQQLSSMSMDQNTVLEVLRPLFAELETHMQHESGQQLKQLDAVLSDSEARVLGQRYAETLVLMPDLTRCATTTITPTEETESIARKSDYRPCFPGGLDDYIKANAHSLASMLAGLRSDSREGIDGGYFLRRINEEVDKLRESARERKARL